MGLFKVSFGSGGGRLFVHRLEKGLDVGGVDVGQDRLVAGREDEPRGEDPLQPQHVGAHLSGRAVHEQVLGIDAAEEGAAVAEVGLQPLGLHLLRTGLDGVDHVDPQIEQLADDRVDRPARVVYDLQTVALGLVDEPFRPWKDVFAQLLGGDEQAVLAAEVVPINTASR